MNVKWADVKEDYARKDAEIQRSYTALRTAYIELSGKSSHDSDCSIHNNPDHMPEKCNCTSN